MDKLSEGWGRKKWNSRYFVLEAHWLNYYHDDEKNGAVTNIDMKQVQNVTILTEHQSRENVLAVSFNLRLLPGLNRHGCLCSHFLRCMYL